MAYDLAKVTANGNNLIAQILANKSSLSVDKIEISDTQLPSTTDISTMTSVPKVVQTVSANGFSKNSNTLIISTVVDNSSIRADYKAWVFGIWGSDSQNGQSQLIAVITSTNSPDTIPAFSGRTPVSYTYKFNIGFSNASQIKFNMINDSFATNDTVVHTTGDETVDGKKTFKVDPVDKNGDAYGLAKDIATKVTDNKDGTEQLNGVKVQPFNKLSDTIGGRNLLINSNFSSGLDHWGTNWGTNKDGKTTVTIDSDGDTCIHITGTGNLCGIWCQPVSFNQNQITTGSVLAKGIGTLGFVGLEGRQSNNFGTISTKSYSKVGSTMQAISNTNNSCVYFNSVNGILDVYIKLPKLEQGSVATDWTPAPEDKVNVSDMRKPASDVAGIEEVNTKQDKIGYTPADDSKVAHLSGANNFDTVPTVNNNPLLLASSLPSDLARTGQANTFTQPQTFSTAPILKSNGKPFITEDELNAGIKKAVDQARADMIAEFNKRNVPSNFWTGSQADFDKINPKDPNTDYRIVEDS